MGKEYRFSQQTLVQSNIDKLDNATNNPGALTGRDLGSNKRDWFNKNGRLTNERYDIRPWGHAPFCSTS